MLRVNVGLSRKVSKDYNSTGFSINLDGEITSTVSDPEAVIEEVKQLYDLAEEALDREIERHRSDSAIASRDEGTPPSNTTRQTNDNGHPPERSAANGHQANGHNGEVATNKQVQYLLNLGKRQGLTTKQLESRIEQLTGKKVGVYELSKREAGDVIDALSQAAPTGNGAGHSRSRVGR
ncbi:hypothetical protein [Anatilimnocola floriformis]|uniref:hypothetical protein n=1 Tax=Anatilimnocola floriformis TaxID=2948575 RepID=UPI0020C21D09|nr:hypothetical protein [Anatilimnocola floriformis]